MPWGRGSAAELVSAVLLSAAAAVGFWHFNLSGSIVPPGTERLERAAVTAVQLESTDREWGAFSVHAVTEAGDLDPAVTGVAAAVWSDFLRIATPEFVERRVAEVRLAHASRSDMIASIERDSARPGLWTLTINLGTRASVQELRRALIHEYAHLLSLDASEFSPRIGACPTTLIQEGCLSPASILHRFASRFWSDEDPAGAKAPDRSGSDFVTPYASTNLVEDFAETFAAFVIGERPTAGPQRSIAKLRFLWAEPQLTAIRERIRAAFGDELGTLWTP